MNEKIRNWRVGLAIVGVLLLSGCATVRQTAGLPYNIEKLVFIKIGMSESEVISLLGEPIAKGKDLDGNPFLLYQYRVISSNAGGFMVATGSAGQSGGEARVVLDSQTHRVKTVKYEIYGTEYYEKLRGGK